MKTFIVVQLQAEGIHRWEECPIEEVKYLRHDHRHVFHIKAVREVFHDNRDVEFIQFKHEIDDYIFNRYYDHIYRCHYFGKMSCEMLAKELLEKFNLESCEVYEDGENGAVVVR